MSKLVIVESPAKAKTISRILGKDYEVLASFGHVRDLPESADEIPASVKAEKWARLGVNVDKDFEPIYVVPGDKKRHVDSLKKALKEASELLLATDEDREGESISWHILQVLKPNKSMSIRRIVFHEITPEAVQAAVKSPRDLDERLVRAQETRRILDRLYGYTLSPLLWKKVAPKLSAGRVQSVAVRLCVLRERERRAFVSAEYWDLKARLNAKTQAFDATLTTIDSKRVSTGRSFDEATGKLMDSTYHLLETEAVALAKNAAESEPWKVASVKKAPGKETPPVPFMTSTLQQEANRKLRWTSKRTMQVAQTLYEGVDLGGERVGLITYMRTDSLNLAERALTEAREVIQQLYGKEYLPASPVRYKTKSKSAQEAHEAIRPTDLSRKPEDVRRYLSSEEFALYDLIWKRTIASQMVAARVLRTSAEIEVTVGGKKLTFQASGKEIEFPGFLRAYVQGSDDPDADLDDRETILPPLTEGQVLSAEQCVAEKHATRPPARYTEASLIRKLEEESIGRPSTYSSIISTIQDRGYIFKKGNELVPTFTAFAVTELLEDHFDELVDLAFTAKLESELDEIADGKLQPASHLRDFYFGNEDRMGIAPAVEQRGPDIPFPSIEIGNDPSNGDPIVVRVGRFGTFVQKGPGGKENSATLEAGFAPAELTVEKALELISRGGSTGEDVTTDPKTGRRVMLRSGRFGAYLELEQTQEEVDSKAKPHRASLPKDLKPADLQEEDAQLLISLPRELGIHPEKGEMVIATIGPYGPYLKCGKENRKLDSWREIKNLTLDHAVELFAQELPARGKAAAAGPTVLKELSQGDAALKVLSGRYGPYVTDGKTNATLPKGTEVEALDYETAMGLIKAREEAGPSKFKRKKGPVRRKK